MSDQHGADPISEGLSELTGRATQVLMPAVYAWEQRLRAGSPGVDVPGQQVAVTLVDDEEAAFRADLASAVDDLSTPLDERVQGTQAAEGHLRTRSAVNLSYPSVPVPVSVKAAAAATSAAPAAQQVQRALLARRR